MMKKTWKFLLVLPVLTISIFTSSQASGQGQPSAAPGSASQPQKMLVTPINSNPAQATPSPTASPSPSSTPAGDAPAPIHTSKQCVTQSEGLPPSSKTAGTLLMHASAYYPEPILDFRRSTVFLSPIPPETGYGDSEFSVSPNGQWAAYIEIKYTEYPIHRSYWYSNPPREYSWDYTVLRASGRILHIKNIQGRELDLTFWQVDWQYIAGWINSQELAVQTPGLPQGAVTVMNPFTGKYRVVTNPPAWLNLRGSSVYSSWHDIPVRSPDGKLAASFETEEEYGSTGKIVLTDAQGNKTALTDQMTFDRWNNDLSWSPDGRFLAISVTPTGALDSYGVEKSLALIDVQQRNIINLCVRSDVSWMSTSPQWSPDRQYLAVASSVEEVTNYGYTYNAPVTLVIDVKNMTSYTIKHAVPYAWMVDPGTPAAEPVDIPQIDALVNSPSPIPAGTQLKLSEFDMPWAYDPIRPDTAGKVTDQANWTLSAGGEVTEIALSDWSRYDAVGSSSGEVYFFGNGNVYQRKLTQNHGGVCGLEYLPHSQNLVTVFDDGTVTLTDVNDPSPIWEATVPAGNCEISMSEDAHTIAISQKLGTGCGQHTIQFLSAGDGNLEAAVDGYSLVFLSDGERFIRGGDDGTLELWGLNPLKKLSAFQQKGGCAPTLRLSVDGTRFLVLTPGSTGGSQALQVIHVADGTPVTTIDGLSDLSAVEFSADGQMIATGSRQEALLRFWTVQDGKEVTQLDAQPASITAIAFSRYGSQIITGGSDSSIFFWGIPYRQ